MKPPAHWLKPIGTSDWLLDPNWVEVAPRELEYVDFADQGKPSVRVDDYLLYYATGYGRLFGIVKIFMPPTLKADGGRWPWEAQVRPGLIIRGHRAGAYARCRECRRSQPSALDRNGGRPRPPQRAGVGRRTVIATRGLLPRKGDQRNERYLP